jgi:hypothetical protein
MVDQAIAKLLGSIKDFQIFVHGIPYVVTFIVIQSNVLNSMYFMLLGHPWLGMLKCFMTGAITLSLYKDRYYQNHTYY